MDEGRVGTMPVQQDHATLVVTFRPDCSEETLQ